MEIQNFPIYNIPWFKNFYNHRGQEELHGGDTEESSVLSPCNSCTTPIYITEFYFHKKSNNAIEFKFA